MKHVFYILLLIAMTACNHQVVEYPVYIGNNSEKPNVKTILVEEYEFDKTSDARILSAIDSITTASIHNDFVFIIKSDTVSVTSSRLILQSVSMSYLSEAYNPTFLGVIVCGSKRHPNIAKRLFFSKGTETMQYVKRTNKKLRCEPKIVKSGTELYSSNDGDKMTLYDGCFVKGTILINKFVLDGNNLMSTKRY